MRRIQPRYRISLTVLLGMTAALAVAQTPQRNSPEQDQPTPAQSPEKPTKKKAPLAGAARVSTDAAREEVAAQAAKKPGATHDSRKGPDAEQAKEHPGSEDVVELHPADSDSATSTSLKTESPKGKKGKDIHGTVYGATDAKNTGTRRGGGAVGATSKSGKTSVYVQTEGARTTPPR